MTVGAEVRLTHRGKAGVLVVDHVTAHVVSGRFFRLRDTLRRGGYPLAVTPGQLAVLMAARR